MQIGRRLIWVFLVAIIGIVSLLFQVGALEVSRDLKIEEWSRALGISEELLMSFATELPEGVRLEDAITQEIEPHTHDWQAAIREIEDDETGTFLTFAHLADGEFPGSDRPFQTTYTLIHNSSFFVPGPVEGTQLFGSVNGMLEFFDDQGASLELEIDGTTASSLPFELLKGRVSSFTTSGSGPLKTGWARIRCDQPIVATSSFGIIREDGTVITDVGVGESALGTKFTIFADTIGDNNTGLALVNPNRDQAIRLQLTLRTSDGLVVAQTTIDVGPLGHISRFVGELFPEVENIDEFEGTLVVESLAQDVVPDNLSPTTASGQTPLPEFAGLTLRISGTILTSVPMVEPSAPEDDFTNLAFPQAADGAAGELSISTTVILFNDRDDAASGVIEFFKGDGTLNEVGVGGQSTNSIPFDIGPGGVFRVSTDGTGELAVGWALVTMDQPLAGVAIFTIRDSAAQIVAAVGVNSALLRRNFQLFANTLQLFNTALALVNPLEPEEGKEDVPVTIRITLGDELGRLAGQTEVQLSARQHTALFLTELFADVEGIEEFEGWVQVSVQERGKRAVAVSLRSAVEKLTSVPIFATQRAFLPAAEVRFAQHLQGTAPSVRVSYHQDSFQWALDQIEIVLPQIGLNTDGLAEGLAMGSGYETSGQSLVRILPTAITDGRVDFDFVLESVSRQTPEGSGSLVVDDQGQLVMSLNLDAGPDSSIIFFSDTVIFFNPEVFVIPANLDEISSLIQLTSVTSSGRAGIIRKMERDHGFEPPDSELAYITKIQPLTLTAGEILSIQGGNFGDAPLVHFPVTEGDPIVVKALSVEEDSMDVVVPTAVGVGEIQVDNGLGTGPGHLTQMYFGPRTTIEAISDEEGDGLQIQIRQKDNLIRLDSFVLRLIEDEPRPASDLEMEQVVGSLLAEPFPAVELTVVEWDENRVVLRSLSGSRHGDLVVERLEETNPGWVIEFVPTFSLTAIQFQTRDQTISIRLNLPFLFPDPEQLILWSATMTSGSSRIGEGTVRNAFEVGGFLRGSN